LFEAKATENENLRHQLDQAEELTKNIIAEKEQLLIKSKLAEEQLNKNTKLIDELKANLAKDCSSPVEIKTAIATLVQEKNELSLTIKQKEVSERSLSDSCIYLKEALATKTTEAENLMTEINRLKETNSSLMIDKTKQEGAIGLCETKIKHLESELVRKSDMVDKLQQQIDRTMKTTIEESSKANDILVQLKKYEDAHVQLVEMEKLQVKLEMINHKLNEEKEVLLAKLHRERKIIEDKEASWKEERSKLLEKMAAQKVLAEERINEVRMEMEGKLEKMKDKMVSVCYSLLLLLLHGDLVNLRYSLANKIGTGCVKHT
jgi:hypothetical protein